MCVCVCVCVSACVCLRVCVLVPVREARLKEIRVEMLNSEKLKVCFNGRLPVVYSISCYIL